VADCICSSIFISVFRSFVSLLQKLVSLHELDVALKLHPWVRLY
jgi:hypothetical protein